MAPAVRTLVRPLIRFVTPSHEAPTSPETMDSPATVTDTQDCSVAAIGHSPVIGMLIGFVLCSILSVFLPR